MSVRSGRSVGLALVLCGLASLAGAQIQPPSVAAAHLLPAGVAFEPLVDAAGWSLTITGPGRFAFSRQLSRPPSFSVFDRRGEPLPDGVYRYELRALPAPIEMGPAPGDRTSEPADGRDSTPRQERLPAPLPPLSGSFTISGGSVVVPFGTPEPAAPGAGRQPAPAGADPGPRDVVVPDDQIVQGSLCVGLDCVNNESFGFDTIRLKENNTRIKFEDTSTSAGFPSTDWQLTANDSASGGLNKFSIEDVTSATVPFTIEGGSTTNSIYVDSTGRVGFRTSTPVLDLHAATGDTPALRFEQNSSGGFTAQTWDVAGNEANFFIRDVTGGSRLPFRIRPGAPTSSIDIANDGRVGIGTGSPAAGSKLHVRAQTGGGPVDSVVLENNGPSRLALKNTAQTNSTTTDQVWTLNSNGNLRFTTGSSTSPRMALDAAGNLNVAGSFLVNGVQLNVPDYVFEPGYDLMALEDLKSFVESHKHLPDIPPAREVSEKGLDLGEMQMRLLRKIEELTLYALQQQETIEQLRSRIESLERPRP